MHGTVTASPNPEYTMHRRLFAAAVTLMLAGCSTGDHAGAPLVDHLSGGKVIGTAEQVSVEGDRVSALPLAVFHCARYHRSAQFMRSENGRAIFRCVAS